MAEIKPPIVLNFTPPAGGGASRFGIEDNTSTTSRDMDMGGKGFIIQNFSQIDYISGSSDEYGELNVFPGYSLLRAQDASLNYAEVYASGAEGVVADAKKGGIYSQFTIDEHGFSLRTVTNGADITSGTVNDFADNAAAIAAGLTIGTIYRTGDLLKITH